MEEGGSAMELAMEAASRAGASVVASVVAESIAGPEGSVPAVAVPAASGAAPVPGPPQAGPPPRPLLPPTLAPSGSAPVPSGSAPASKAYVDEAMASLRPVFLEEPPEHVKCGICYDLLLRGKGPVQMSCGHLFCRECLSRAFARKRQCPQCRMATPAGQPFEACVSRSLLCSQVIDALAVRCPYGVEVVDGGAAGGVAVPGATTQPSPSPESLLDVIGGSTTPSPGDASLGRRGLGGSAVSFLDGTASDSEYVVLHSARVREREGGCRALLKLGNLETHLRECPHARVRCPHHLLGCLFEGLRVHLDAHVVSECEYEKVSRCLAIERTAQRAAAAELEERLGARMVQLEATVKALREENRRLKQEQMRQGAALFASSSSLAGMPGPVLSSVVTVEGDLVGTSASSSAPSTSASGPTAPWSAVPAWRGASSTSRVLRSAASPLPSRGAEDAHRRGWDANEGWSHDVAGLPSSPPTPGHALPVAISGMPLAPPGKVTHIVTPSTSPAVPPAAHVQHAAAHDGSPQDPLSQQSSLAEAGAGSHQPHAMHGASAASFRGSSGDLAVVHHSTLGSALKAAGNGDVIYLQAGTYIESVSVLKGVTIVGEGLPELLLPAGEALLCDAEGVELRGLCIRSCDAGAPDGYALRVRGGSLTLKGCDVASARLSCVIVMGGSRAVLQGNRIHGSGQDGVIVGGGGVATLRGNEIFGHVLSGVEVTGADTRVELFGNVIHSNQQAGVYVHDRAQALVQGCHIFSNDKVNVNATSEGKIVLRDNLISVGRQHGAYATGGGKLIAERNRILANAFSGLCIEGGGILVADGNEVQLNRMWGICIGEGANHCQLGPCDMRGNALGGLNAPPEALASIRSIENRRQGELLIRELSGGIDALGVHSAAESLDN